MEPGYCESSLTVHMLHFNNGLWIKCMSRESKCYDEAGLPSDLFFGAYKKYHSLWRRDWGWQAIEFQKMQQYKNHLYKVWQNTTEFLFWYVNIPSASTSLIISWSSASVGFCPRDRITVPSSFVVIVPSPSLSNSENASLNSASQRQVTNIKATSKLSWINLKTQLFSFG